MLFTNLELLLYEYLLVCGFDYLCNKDVFGQNSSRPEGFGFLHKCPDCYCDFRCIYRGNCCPDFYFRLPEMAYEDVTITGPPYINDSKNKPRSYLMAIGCPPENWTSNISETCYSNVSIQELFNLPPVTSVANYVTYKNKFCAMCHGESKFKSWSVSTRCEKFTDFNFLSSIPEILQVAVESSCFVEFDPGNIPACNETEYKLKDECPQNVAVHKHVTGLQLDVFKACASSYNLPYRNFKNIFCYMCNNPPDVRVGIDIISECDKSVEMNAAFSQTSLHYACTTFNYSASTFPFKNIFCYFCNLRNTSVMFNDASLDIRENTIGVKKFINISNIAFDTIFIANQLKNVKISNIGSNRYKSPDIVNFNGVDLNITHLLLQKMAFHPIDEICNNFPQFVDYKYMMYSQHRKRCSCNPACMFVYSEHETCCLDTVLTYETSCFESFRTNMRSRVPIPTASSCWKNGQINYVPDAISTLCETNDNGSVLLNLPIVGKSGIIYKNIFCLMCSDFDIEYEPMELYINCLHDIDLSHHVSLTSILEQVIGDDDCTIVLMPNQNVATCYPYIDVPGVPVRAPRCDVDDHDVLWACQTAGLYQFEIVSVEGKSTLGTFKNIFCGICILDMRSEPKISTCNITGLWDIYDSRTEEACLLFPDVRAMHPFKNRFCQECNSLFTVNFTFISKPLPEPPPPPPPPPTGCYSCFIPGDDHTRNMVSFRSLFSLKSHSGTGSKTDPNCNKDNQVLDIVTVSTFV